VLGQGRDRGPIGDVVLDRMHVRQPVEVAKVGG
jgi:hypothetical protein